MSSGVSNMWLFYTHHPTGHVVAYMHIVNFTIKPSYAHTV